MQTTKKYSYRKLNIRKYLKAQPFTLLDILVLATIVLIGVVHLPHPFMGDQALNTIMASKMSQGEIIYRDLWDLKHPGIFCFFLVGGKLFGFNEIGIHLFELLYMITFSIILLLAFKSYFKNQWVASIVPLLTVGMYYAVSGTQFLTQTEALVGFPMFLCLWFAYQSTRSSSKRTFLLFLSGFMGGIVLLFKFVLMPILGIFWLTILIDAKTRKLETIPTVIFRVGAPIILGILPPFIIAIAYFAWHDILNIVYWTFFEYPSRAIKQVPFRVGTLKRGLHWFIVNFSSLMILGLIGTYFSERKNRDLMRLNLQFWLVLGLGIILIQYLSWWAYHYLLLLVPLGVLGALGIDILWSWRRQCGPTRAIWKDTLVGIFCIALVFLTPLSNLANKSLKLASHNFAINKEDRLKHQIHFNKTYKKVFSEVAFLSEQESLPGEIYVFADPLYYFLSGRDPAIPLLAPWFTSLPEQWEELLDMLDKARPPYIFVDENSLEEVRNYTPKTAPYVDKTIPSIEKNYRLLYKSDAGMWYVLQDYY